MTENTMLVAEVDETDNSVNVVKIARMGILVTFVPNLGIEDVLDKLRKSGITDIDGRIGALEGIVVGADIQVKLDKSDNVLNLGNATYSVTYDIRVVTLEGDETDIVVKSDWISEI